MIGRVTASLLAIVSLAQTGLSQTSVTGRWWGDPRAGPARTVGVDNRSGAGLTLNCDLTDGLQLNLFTYKPTSYVDDISLETSISVGTQQVSIHMRYNSYTRKHSKDGTALFVWDVKTGSDQNKLLLLLQAIEAAGDHGTVTVAMSGTTLRETFPVLGARRALEGFPLDCNAQL